MWVLQAPKHATIDAKGVACAKSGGMARHQINLVGEVDGVKCEGDMAVEMSFE